MSSLPRIDAEIEVVQANICSGIGEGPHWDEKKEELLYVDILENKFHKWQEKTGAHSVRHFEEPVTFAIPRHDGGYVMGLGRTIAFYDWDQDKLRNVAELAESEKENNRLNDGKCDARGRLWTGSMGNEPVATEVDLAQGVLGCLDTDQKWKQHIAGIDISNGIAWSLDNTLMYYIDSIPRKVYVFDYDITTGSIANQRTALDFATAETSHNELGFPDGCCIDSHDMLWIACYTAGKIVRFDPKYGLIAGVLRLPTSNITSCCFGGPAYTHLYVTSAARGIPEEKKLASESTCGSIFRVTVPGVRGLAAPLYAG